MSKGLLLGAISGSQRPQSWLFSSGQAPWVNASFIDSSNNIVRLTSRGGWGHLITNADGKILSNRKLENSPAGIISVEGTSDGMLYSVGSANITISDTLRRAATIVKNNYSGAISWHKGFIIGGDHGNQRVAVTADGAHLYFAFVRRYVVSDPNGPWYTTILKINQSNGSIAWSRELVSSFGLGAFVQSIAVHSNGNLYVSGTDRTDSQGGGRGFLVKYDASGNLQWQRTFIRNNAGSFTQVMSIQSIRLDSSENIYMSGTYRYAGDPTYGEALYYAKLNSSGSTVFQHGIVSNPISSQTFPMSAFGARLHGQGSDNFIEVYGYLNKDVTNTSQGYVIKLSDGTLSQSVRVYDPLNPSSAFINSMEVSSDNSLYVAVETSEDALVKFLNKEVKAGRYSIIDRSLMFENFPTQLVTPPITISNGNLSSSSLSESLILQDISGNFGSNIAVQEYLRRI